MKNKSKGFMIFSILLSILLILVTGALVYQVVSLEVLPTKLLIPVIIFMIVLTLLILVILNFVPRKKVTKALSSIFTVLIIVVFAFGNWYVYSTASMLTRVTDNEGKVKNTISVIVKDSSSIEDIKDVKGKVAVLKSIDTYGTDKCLKSVEKELGVKKSKNYKNLPFKTAKYSSVPQEVDALFNNDVEAIIMNESYRPNVTELDDYKDFDSSTKVIYQMSFYTKKKNEALVVSDVTTTPFNILISGNDSYGDIEEVSRSDVNMVVTVNPVTNTVLMTSIPRDTYVETACDAKDVCQQGAMDKITHTGMHGVNTTRRTIEKLLGIDINYTFRVNFSSVINLVDALDGIDIEIPKGKAVPVLRADDSLEGVKEGMNHLDGKRALAFARERYAYQDGDNQRIRNQQEVMMAIVKKAVSPSIIKNYTYFMDALSGSFETNMSTDEITSLLKYQLQSNADWKFEQYQIEGAGGTYFCAELGQGAYASVPDKRTIKIAKEKIEAVMKGESSNSVDTSFLKTTSPEYDMYDQVEGISEEVEEQVVVESSQDYIEPQEEIFPEQGNEGTTEPVLPEPPVVNPEPQPQPQPQPQPEPLPEQGA